MRMQQGYQDSELAETGEDFDDDNSGIMMKSDQKPAGDADQLALSAEFARNGRKENWARVLITIFVIFVVSQTSLILITFYAIHPSVPTPNTDKLYDDDMLDVADIVEETVPFVQDWFNDLQEMMSETAGGKEMEEEQPFDLLLLENNNDGSKKNDTSLLSSSCLDPYFKGMQESITHTSPRYVKFILQNLGLHHNPPILTALHKLLTEPQPLQVLYEDSQRCLGDNDPFVALACVANEVIGGPPNLNNDTDTKIVYQYGVNFAAVLETLTLYLEKDFHALSEMAEFMATSRRRFDKKYRMSEQFQYAYSSKTKRSRQVKYDSVIRGMKFLVTDEPQKNPASSTPSLQLNIMEAVKLELQNKREDNARVGLALAATAYTGDFLTESNELLSRLSKEWIDAYIAWNFVFFTTSSPPISLLMIGKLMIPSISCTGNMHDKSRFLTRRVISLALSLMHVYPPNNPGELSQASVRNDTDTFTNEERSVLFSLFDDWKNANHLQGNLSQAASLGRSNLENVKLTNPDKDTVWKMFYTICGERCHEPSWKMTDSSVFSRFVYTERDDFFLFMAFVNWLTAVLTGLGMEVFMVTVYLRNGWTKTHDIQWKIAKHLFPLLALTTLGLAVARNYLAMLTLVVGLYKFGFPETVALMYSALYDVSLRKVERVSLALDSVGLLLHHSAAALFICMLINGVATPDRFMLAPILILCIQHWFAFLNYRHKLLYGLILFFLEILFQWSLLSNFEHWAQNHWIVEVAAFGMLLSHWIWFVSAGLPRLSVRGFKQQKETKKYSTYHDETSEA